MHHRIDYLFVAILTLALTACGSGGNSGGAGGALSFISGGLQISYTVGGTVSGLAGSGLVLQNNAGDDLAVGADGGFTFGSAMESGETYNVTVLTQPASPLQSCTVTDGSGTVGGNDVTNVQVACIILGDINGDGVVNHVDALLAQRIALGMITATPEQITRGDIHPDGKIDASDYLLIQKMGLGL